MKTKLTKEQILEYFTDTNCSDCEFKKECDSIIDYSTLCSLLGFL